MAEQAKVPAIRFAGFTDPWEQRKASEVFQIVDDRGHPTLPVLSATQDQGMIYRDDSGRYIGHDESNEIGYKRVLPGDFVVHLRSFQGGFAHSQYEGITSPAYTVFRAKEPTSHSDRFWKHWFMSEHFIAGLSTVTYGIRDGRSISVDEFMNTFSAFPAVEEQAAISRLLDYLDDLITLHQRKYDKLVILKKSMLEKMFPKDGESVPEIRFAGFTDPWEQRKLGEVATIVGGGTPSTNNDAYWDGDIDWYSPAELGEQVYAERSARRITQAGYDSCSATLLPAGKTILFTSRAGIGNTAILRRSACTNQGFQSLVVNDDTDVYFVYSMTDRIKKFAERKASGSTFLEISGKGLAAGEFAFPSKDEQTAIGSMFKQLDFLITLHQRKLELLQNIKKSLLDKMFV